MAENSEGGGSNGTQEQHVFVMRHGERQDGVHRDWWKTAKRPYDTPLSSRGHSETSKLIERRLAGKVREGKSGWLGQLYREKDVLL